MSAYSQVSVNASIDSTQLMIGQQSAMHLKISGPSSKNYILPQFPGDTLVNGIEILLSSKVDTVKQDNGEVQLKVDYLITSFDTGLYYIPPIKVLADKDSFLSNNMALKVLTYDVDTTKAQLFDIKGVQKPQFVISDYYIVLIIILLSYLAALFIIWMILRKKYRNAVNTVEDQDKYLPPHIRALFELDKLKVEKMWRSGKNKEYYTRLSDIIRDYIQRRFQINALEMTTGEILPLFSKDKITQSVYQNLKQILQLSDLVKFAKYTPLEDENELSLMNAFLFVNQTKFEEVQSIDEQKEAFIEKSESNNSSNIVDDNQEYLKKFQRK
jgi:hypothetical protein